MSEANVDFRQIEEKHYALQHQIYFSGSDYIQGARVLFSDVIEDLYWNYAAQIDVSIEDAPGLIERVTQVLNRRGRQPAFFVVPWTSPVGLADLLHDRGFEIGSEEAWVVGSPKRVSDTDRVVESLTIDLVRTTEDVEAFAATFEAAYGYVSDEVPYGGLPETYGHALRASLNRTFTDRVVLNYLARLDGVPAGVGTAIHAGGYAGLYGLGVAPQFRRRGVGRALAVRRLADLADAGVRTAFFQTEAGGLVERMYSDLGFDVAFNGACWAPA